MNDLETIVATALIGTERQGLPPISLAPDLKGDSREAVLLSAAALVGTYRRAGFVPGNRAETLEPSGADVKPEMTPTMQNLLHRVLGHGALVEELLELLTKKGVRLSHRDLPLLLDNGRQSTQQRARIMALLDTRGRWLAGLNKNWSWATGNTESIEDAVQSFETGTKSARSLAFQTIREADPARALSLLETTWKQDAAPERKEFIALLGTKLSNTDESFLEAALSDRSSDVRDIAANLLAQIPESAFNARMRERLRPILQVVKPKAKNVLESVKQGVQGAFGVNTGKLEVELPDTFDPDWAKDGIVEKAPQSVGQKQWWVRQMMSRVTLPMLEEITGLDAIQLLKNTHKDWQSFVQQAVTSALNQSPEPELVKRVIAYDTTMIRNSSRALSVLEPSFLENLCAQRTFLETNTDLTYLAAAQHTWSETFWTAALEWIAGQATRLQQGKASQYFHGFGTLMVRSTPLELIPRLLNGHTSLPGWSALLQTVNAPADEKQKNQWYWEYAGREIRDLIATLQLRLEMHEVMR